MIDLAVLKQEIQQNKFSKGLLICICKDESSIFVAKQYLHYYAKANGYDIIDREDITHSAKLSVWSQEESSVCLHKTDELKEAPVTNDNIWIITSKVTPKIKTEYDEYIVEIPKLEDWQIVDYATSISELTDEQAKKLIAEYKDITKLDIEIQKLIIFRDNKFDELIDQLLFKVDTPIFELINGLVKRDREAVANFVVKDIDIDPFGFLTLIKKNIKQVIDIQLAQKPTPESTGLTQKQFWAVQKYSCGHYNREELLYLYDVLTQVDSQIKMGDLDTSHVVNYILGKFLRIMQ